MANYAAREARKMSSARNSGDNRRKLVKSRSSSNEEGRILNSRRRVGRSKIGSIIIDHNYAVRSTHSRSYATSIVAHGRAHRIVDRSAEIDLALGVLNAIRDIPLDTVYTLESHSTNLSRASDKLMVYIDETSTVLRKDTSGHSRAMDTLHRDIRSAAPSPHSSRYERMLVARQAARTNSASDRVTEIVRHAEHTHPSSKTSQASKRTSKRALISYESARIDMDEDREERLNSSMNSSDN